jgi:hypothetical protein
MTGCGVDAARMAAGNSRGANRMLRTRCPLWWLRAKAGVLKQVPATIKAASVMREVLRNSMMLSLVMGIDNFLLSHKASKLVPFGVKKQIKRCPQHLP